MSGQNLLYEEQSASRAPRSKLYMRNQKSLKLLQRIIVASSDEHDVVWEPFGGMCSAAIGSLRTGRRCYAAEIDDNFYPLAAARLCGSRDLFSSWDEDNIIQGFGIYSRCSSSAADSERG